MCCDILINNFEEIIKNNINKQCMIYISIGSANINDTLRAYHQQYPVFLNDINKLNKNIPICIFLFDKMLETPPCMLTHLYFTINNFKKKKINDNYFTYTNDEEQIYIHSLNYNVIYKTDTSNNRNLTNNMLDITLYINKVVETVSNNKWLMVFQDFTGKEFKNMMNIYGHFKNILFGLGFDDDYGCLYDTTLYNARLAYIICETSKNISFFNPKNEFQYEPFKFYNWWNKYKEIYNDTYNNKIIWIQLNDYIKTHIKKIKNEHLLKLRHIKIKKITNTFEIEQTIDLFKFQLNKLLIMIHKHNDMNLLYNDIFNSIDPYKMTYILDEFINKHILINKIM